MPATKRADVWVLLGPHRGDNRQVLALAEGLGVPFRPIQMRYHWFAHLPGAFCAVSPSRNLSPRRAPRSRRPGRRLVIGIGQRSVPVARYIKEASGGRTTIVRLGDPMVSPSLLRPGHHHPSICSSRRRECRPAAGHDHQSPDCAGCAEERWLRFIPAPAPADRDRRRDIAVATESVGDRAASQRPCACKGQIATAAR